MIRVSQRLEYALRVLVALAQLPAGTRVAAGELAQRLGLPRRFVEQQVTELARARVVECARGAGGGCLLASPASEITVLDVVSALDRAAFDVPRTTGSVVTELWGDVVENVASELQEVDLAQLAERQRAIDLGASEFYDI